MRSLFIDCPTGLSGDLILAGLIDLGVPISVIEESLFLVGLKNSFSIKAVESKSFGLRGLRLFVKSLERSKSERSWSDIRHLILNSDLSSKVRSNSLAVFKSIAKAEALVHGNKIEDVHFHEVGSIDSLVDVIGVCAAVEYLKLDQIICSTPPLGHGSVETEHGLLPVPAPAVLEIAKANSIKIFSIINEPPYELTTPTGLALMSVLANSFGMPSEFELKEVGVGLGHRKLDRPNLLRACLINDLDPRKSSKSLNELHWQRIIVQESWIDDSTPEELAQLIDELRSSGAIDVICQPVQMKKGRQGVSVKALVSPEKASTLRLVWFDHGTTIGLRESNEGRWVLERRRGSLITPYGKVLAKQVKRPDGHLSIKVEHDELVRLSRKFGRKLHEFKEEILDLSNEFIPEEEWKC